MVKKGIALMLGLLLALTSLSALAAEKTTIRYMTFEDGDWQKFSDSFIQSYMEKNPDVTIQYEPTSYDECMTKLKTTIAAGTAPDVVWADAFLEMVSKGAFLPLDDFIAKYQVDLSAYNQAMIDMCTYEGKLYALCGWSGMTAIFYNKEIFDNAGVPYPQEGWTWDDVSRIAPLLTSGEGADKIYALNFNLDWMGAIETICWGNGARLFSEETMEIAGAMNSDKMVEALTWYTSFVKNGYAPQASTLKAMGGSADEMFKAGKLAMTYGFFGFISSLKANGGFDMDKLGVIHLPVGEAGMKPCVNTLFTTPMCITRDSKNPEEAFKFLLSRVSGDVMREFCGNGWATPAMPSLVPELGLLDSPLTHYFGDVLANSDKYIFPKPTGNYHPQYSQITDALIDAVTKIVIENMDVRQALDEAVQTLANE